MKDHNEMTLDECRDELARIAGWCVVNNCSCDLATHGPNSHWTKDTGDCYRHPIPATLDEAAKLPEGWIIDFFQTVDTERFWARVRPRGRSGYAYDEDGCCLDPNAEGDTELEARFRLRVAIERKLFPKETSEY